MAQAASRIEEPSQLPDEGVDPISAEQRQQDIKDRLMGVVETLQRQALDQVARRQIIEDRWIEDLRQYHGRYDETTETNLAKDKTKSRLFVNKTRTKTHGWEARLSDLLYPTEDRNWAISATPVPELTRQASQAQDGASLAADRANMHLQTGDVAAAQQEVDRGQGLAEQHAKLEISIAEARERADLMEEEIADQLVQSRYDQRCRDAIRDMCRLGTAVTKGPVAAQAMRRKWEMATGDGAAGGYALGMSPDPKPEGVRVDLWNFFPDMSVANIESAEFTYERHLWNAKDLRAAAKRLGFDLEETAEILKEGSKEPLPNYWNQLRTITDNSSQFGADARYQIWEYHGSIEGTDLEAIVTATGNTKLLDFVTDNPLAELKVIMFFCQGRLLKIGPHPLDSGETLYCVCPFEVDDTSIFGFGVPYLMRDSQKAINAAWRMTMDNAALSVGPQVVIDQQTIRPADGLMDLRPRKIWLLNSTSLSKMPVGYKPFQTFAIPSGQAELERIVNMANQFADDETNMPPIAYGEQATHITKTAQGMSMLMNSVNVVFRRVVKQWDDYMTVPMLRRFYDWNMQFSKREDIKGDYNVEARGSSVLLVREVQSQTLLSTLTQFSNNPVLGPLIKTPETLRKFFQTQMIHADDVVKTDAQIAADQARAQAEAKKGSQIDPTKQAEIKSKEKIAAGEQQTRVQVAELGRETALIALAETRNMKLEDLSAKLQIKKADIDHKERIAAVEVQQADKHHRDDRQDTKDQAAADAADPKLGNL